MIGTENEQRAVDHATRAPAPGRAWMQRATDGIARKGGRSILFAGLAVLATGFGYVLPAAAQSGSNASNYGSGAQVSINGRTGDVTLAVTLVRLPGVVSELGTTLALSYRSEDARSAIQSNTRHFGLPFGWSLGLSFIYSESTGINSEGTAIKLNVDGSQVYQLDDNWRTSFTPLGADTPQSVKTGLLQYNRADANLKSDAGSVEVNGLGSAFVFTNLEGQVKYFSPGGLMIREADRFGNTIDYHFTNSVTGNDASNSTTTANAELSEIIDTWGNSIEIGPCLDPQTCVANETRVTMSDGRTIGWVSPDDFTVTEIIDTEGMVTHIEWENSDCADQSYGNRRLASMTMSVGGMTSLDYECLDVCDAPSGGECASSGAWSVASELIECPTNESGVACPAGSPNGDYLTTRYQYGTTEDNRNYTGFPRYSPFQPSVAGADALMSAPDAGSFAYTSVVSKHRVGGQTIHQVETDYNFLHLQQEQRVLVSDGNSPTLQLSKETSHCYAISDTEPTAGCPLTSANYQNLPSNYQSAIVMGSCQYNVGAHAGSGGGRRSTVTMTHDAFGNVVRKRIYHATGEQGIVPTCDRSTRLSTAGMRLVVEDHSQHDTPTTVTDDYVDLGSGSGNFGMLVGQQSLIYLDEDDSGVGAHKALQATEGPVLVKLLCNSLTDGPSGGEAAGANILAGTSGLMTTSAAAPTTLGIIDACPQPGDNSGGGVGSSWTAFPAPPKTTSYSYDAVGRSLTQATGWAAGYTAPGGVASTTQDFAYALTAANGGEEACPGSDSVLQITSTDGQGHSTVNRVCTLNGFHLSAADAHGNTTLMEHSANGLTTKTTHSNGTLVETQHYYACPTAQDGRTSTCPSSSTVLQDCPFDSEEQKRNCIVQTMRTSNAPTPIEGLSFLDGVKNVKIRDGLGRIVELQDDLGGTPGAGYTAMQTTKTMTFDDRGMLQKSARLSGATNPLVYETQINLDAKLRPSLVCGPRQQTHQFVHDDVNQITMAIFNGSDREAYTTNDSSKLTTIANCDLTAGQTTSGPTGCATVASDLTTADCDGDAYFTYTLHDGSGQEHSVAAMAGDTTDLGASVTGVNGVTTYSADLLKYGYSLTSSNDANTQVAASSVFTRDVQGHVLEQVITVDVTSGSGATPTPVTTSSTFTSDLFSYNNIDQKTRERNKLSELDGAPSLEETYTYDAVGNLDALTTYEGVTFHNYYDDRNRLVRHCFPTESGSEGEKMALDPITGAIMKVTRFTNTGSCSEADAGDVDVVSETYEYNRFGGIESITYSDGTRLEWAYDPYHRVACFADALATQNGGSCPESPVAVGYEADASEMLVWYIYWEDSDAHRRGLAKGKCRGVPDGSGGFQTKCIEMDYYRSIDSGGTCSSALSSLVGAYASLVKTETYCTGGRCDGGGTMVYQTTRRYDEHRRPCLVESVNTKGAVMLSSAYRYDQFDDVVHEENTSEIDTTDDSNYQIDYVYDGLLRVIEETRNDSTGDLIRKTTFEYDAASNLVRKTEEEPDALVFPPGTPTPGVTDPPATEATTSPTTPAETPTTPASTATRPPRTATPPPAPTARPVGDDSCQISSRNTLGWQILLPLALLVPLRRRGRRAASTHPKTLGLPGE